MSFNVKNPLSSFKTETSPPAPMIGARGLFPKEDGWYDINDDGGETRIATAVDLTNYAKKTDISTVYKFKGTANIGAFGEGENIDYSSFEVGDVYNILGNGTIVQSCNIPVEVYDIFSGISAIFADFPLVEEATVMMYGETQDDVVTCTVSSDSIGYNIGSNVEYILNEYIPAGDYTIFQIEFQVNNGDNIVWTGKTWDKLSGMVDLSNYQTKLTFDETPTLGSTNPVTSDGVAFEAVQLRNEITINTDKISTIEAMAKGANWAVSFNSYYNLVGMAIVWEKDKYNVGQNVMIVTLNVPDLWISEISGSYNDYEYTSDDDFVEELSSNGYVHIGYYKFSALETQKVDLTEYQTKLTFDETPAIDSTNPVTSDGVFRRIMALDSKLSNVEYSLMYKQDIATVIIYVDDEYGTVMLRHNQEARLATVPEVDGVPTLSLVLPDTITQNYESYLCFTSGDVATNVIYSGIKFVGVDCDSDGVFSPMANVNYEIAFKNLGTGDSPNIIARVGSW